MSPARLLYAASLIALWLLLCLWAWRGARARQRTQQLTLATLNAPGHANSVLIVHASQTGFAESLAQQTAAALTSGGLDARIAELGQLDLQRLQDSPRILFIVSTYGEGDAPDSAARFADSIMNVSSASALAATRYGILALGDSAYQDFCGFGRRLDQWLRAQGAQQLSAPIEVDKGDAAALAQWQTQLGKLGAQIELPDWQSPSYQAWTLRQRVLLNPGSQGKPCFHLVLTPQSADALVWQAGDIIEIAPRRSLDAELEAPRDYSIASLPADGSVHVLVRQRQDEHGALGLASTWLTQIAPLGQRMDARIRVNRNFHLPADDRPLILIGNGTGIAGLRALLKARIERAHPHNWLIFGERNAAHDWLWRAEIEQWRAQGQIRHVDAVFSRDQAQRRYVQDHLLASAPRLQDWVARGAAIYVCGSLQGMAAGVDQALTQILGAAGVQSLRQSSRYRRDVY